jgi:hypothetical protein
MKLNFIWIINHEDKWFILYKINFALLFFFSVFQIKQSHIKQLKTQQKTTKREAIAAN